ncbi:LuxR C-terminal-related transcriptional regulator [Gordonia sp. CPCC 205333]|uniref:LuxR C-terminal-related transcriptional regulator n=1 Tax=Gordonia sp. CPCC 205333 TaxID=3140790 RepID=UPI003AF40087
MTATAADAHVCEQSIRRNREALERLASRRTVAPGPVQTVWPVDISRHRLGVVGGGHIIRRFVNDPIVDENIRVGSGVDDLLRPALSPREIEVLRSWLVLDSKLAVAESLFIAMGTVNTHLTRIRAKYADVGRPAPTKASLVARAVQDGIIALDDL